MTARQEEAPLTVPEVEQALIGALLIDPAKQSDLAEALKGEWFADPLHRRLFELIGNGLSAGRPIDARLALAEVGPENGQYLAAIISSWSSVGLEMSYRDALRDAYVRRLVSQAGADIAQAAGHARLDLRDPFSAVDAALRQVSDAMRSGTGIDAIGTSARLASEQTRRAMLNGSAIDGIATGYRRLDRLLGGIQPELYMIAARPAMGKTAFGIGLAARIAAQGIPVYFWSGEMSGIQITQRLIAAWTGYSIQTLRTGGAWRHDGDDADFVRLGREEMAKIENAAAEVARLPIFIDCQPALQVSQLRRRVQRMMRTHGVKILIADYGGLLRPSTEALRSSRYEQTTEIAHDLHTVSQELLPVIALQQLNRAVESREDNVPSMSDLRDTGAWEEDSAVVMLLHREHYYLKQRKIVRKRNEKDADFHQREIDLQTRTEETAGRATVLVPKNRFGPPSQIEMLFHDKTTWFRCGSELPHDPVWTIAEPPSPWV
jgi:replicative DNA helicase